MGAGPGSLLSFRNLGGRFEIPSVIDVVSHSLGDLVVVDVDSDGVSDIVDARMDGNSGKRYWYRGLGNGKFEKEPLWPVEISIPSISFPAFGDFDGDGDLDYVAILSNGFPRSVVWIEQAGAPSREPGSFEITSFTNPEPARYMVSFRSLPWVEYIAESSTDLLRWKMAEIAKTTTSNDGRNTDFLFSRPNDASALYYRIRKH